jgi:predicted alpha/beta-fold hydrolase
MDYYQQSSCVGLLKHLQVQALIVASADDPIVPINCFRNIAHELRDSTTLLMPDQGGHVGFIGPGRRCWMDDVLLRWINTIGER